MERIGKHPDSDTTDPMIIDDGFTGTLTCDWDTWVMREPAKAEKFDRDFLLNNVQDFLISLQVADNNGPNASIGQVSCLYNITDGVLRDRNIGYTPQYLLDTFRSYGADLGASGFGAFADTCYAFVSKWEKAREQQAKEQLSHVA